VGKRYDMPFVFGATSRVSGWLMSGSGTQTNLDSSFNSGMDILLLALHDVHIFCAKSNKDFLS
jgi:hypothetical protein